MKNHELLDLIGEAGEDYVLEADSGGPRPRPRWKAWAAAAACAALALGIRLAGRMRAVHNPAGASYENLEPPLHAYTVVEGGSPMVTLESGGAEVLTGGANDSAAESTINGDNTIFPSYEGDAPADEPVPAPDPGASASDPGAPVLDPEAPAPGILSIDQRTAIAQYHRLVLNCGLEDNPPEWYAGAWLDNDQPDNVVRLAVSIVEGCHTPELEAQIQDWCGEVLFVQDMKYPYACLLDMLEQINQALALHLNQDDIWSTFSSMAPDIEHNFLAVNFCGLPSDEALAFLAQLDPEGDAIRVRVFTGRIDVADDLVNIPEPAADPSEPAAVPGGAWVGTDCEPEPTPTPIAEDLPQRK